MHSASEPTQGSETSQYLVEKKSTETPSVAASERGHSPNQSSDWGCGSSRSYKGAISRTVWKGRRHRVTAPYATIVALRREDTQSSTDVVKLRVKPGGPPSKAKYSWTTDSEQVWRLKGEKNRNKRS